MSPSSTNPSVVFNRLLARGRLRHLHLLVALADAGSVQRAAAVVGMSQPAATQALVDLEDLFGAPLFERHARGVRATGFGQAVVPVARNVLQALRSSTESVAALRAGAHALLRLGCIPAAASSLLCRALPRLVAAEPGLRIELTEHHTDYLLPELAAGRLDAVLCRRQHAMPPQWRFELLQQDEPVVVTAPGHPLASRRRIPLEALALQPWVLPPRGIGVRDYHEQLWAGHPSPPPLYALETTVLPVVLDVMRATGAVGILPRSMVQQLVEWGVVAVLDVVLPAAPQAALEGLGLLTTGDTDLPGLTALRAQLRGAAGGR